MDIIDLLPEVGAGKLFLAEITKGVVIEGTLQGINLVEESVYFVRSGDISGRWVPLYFQLNRNHPKVYKITPKNI